MKFKYITQSCASLDEGVLKKCSALFSSHYGYYSAHAPKLAGERVKLGVGYYKQLALKENTYVSLAFNDEELVGQAFYVLENTPQGYLSWIIQLVVHKDARGLGIARKLLLSVWGFSNDSAWGLATSNPLTIKVLESATFRKVSFTEMQKNMDAIKTIAQQVSFIDPDKISVSKDNASVNTEFYVDHNTIPEKIAAYEKNGEKWIFGDLAEGHEWLAFIFQEQEIVNLTTDKLEKLLDDSESCLIDAYSRMQISEMPWAKGTPNEVDFITKYCSIPSSAVVDFGCGTGRHLAELSARGYHDLLGIDFSENHIQYCKDNHPYLADAFMIGDCRHLEHTRSFDYALCLYDVIGSFPKIEDNLKILQQIYACLTDGGIAIVSVMNMELTEELATNVIDVYQNPHCLFKLKASNTMQKTGNIFNPNFFLIDSRSGNVFRKEKFTNDGGLSAEYIVRDRRFKQKEIEAMAITVGFEIIESRFVQAGKWDTPLANLDEEAKEIVLVLRK